MIESLAAMHTHNMIIKALSNAGYLVAADHVRQRSLPGRPMVGLVDIEVWLREHDMNKAADIIRAYAENEWKQESRG